MLPDSPQIFEEVDSLSEQNAINDAFSHAVRLLDVSKLSFLERGIGKTAQEILALYRSSNFFELARESVSGEMSKQKLNELFDLERRFSSELDLITFKQLQDKGLFEKNNFGLLIPHWSARIIHDADGQLPIDLELGKIVEFYDIEKQRNLKRLDYVPVMRIMPDVTVQVPHVPQIYSRPPIFFIAIVGSTFGYKPT